MTIPALPVWPLLDALKRMVEDAGGREVFVAKVPPGVIPEPPYFILYPFGGYWDLGQFEAVPRCGWMHVLAHTVAKEQVGSIVSSDALRDWMLTRPIEPDMEGDGEMTVDDYRTSEGSPSEVEGDGTLLTVAETFGFYCEVSDAA